jgi:hypothetical protein
MALKFPEDEVLGTEPVDPTTGLLFPEDEPYSTFTGTVESTFDIRPYKRFFEGKVHPEFGQDYLDRVRAERQSGTEQFGAFLNQAIVGEIVGGTLEGAGYLLDVDQTVNILNDVEQDWGNWLSDIGKDLRTWSQEATPIYTTYEPGQFRPDKWSWWMSNGPSVASTLSLLVPTLGATKGISMLGKAADISLNMGKKAKWLSTGIGQAVVSRLMENGMEAAGKYDEIEQRNLQAGMSPNEAKKNASIAASDIWNKNWVLMAQDIPQYLILGKAFGKASKPATLEMSKSMGFDLSPILARKGALLLEDAITEGGEEVMQYIVSENADYLSRASLDPTVTKKSISDYLGEGELWTSFTMGALGSTVFQTVGRRINKAIFGEDPVDQARINNINTWAPLIKLYGTSARIAEERGDILGAQSLKVRHASEMAAKASEVGNLQFSIDFLTAIKNASTEELQNFNLDEADAEFIKTNYDELVDVTKKVGNYFESYTKDNYDFDIASRLARAEVERELLMELSEKYRGEAQALNSKIPIYTDKDDKGNSILSITGKTLVNLSSQLARKWRILTQTNISLKSDYIDNPVYYQNRGGEIEKEILDLKKEISKIYIDEYSNEDKKKDSKYLNISKKGDSVYINIREDKEFTPFKDQQELYAKADFTREGALIQENTIKAQKELQAERNAGTKQKPVTPTEPVTEPEEKPVVKPEEISEEQRVADIENRRRITNENFYVEQDEKGLYEYYINPEGRTEEIRGKSEKDIRDKINAKYDAELEEIKPGIKEKRKKTKEKAENIIKKEPAKAAKNLLISTPFSKIEDISSIVGTKVTYANKEWQVVTDGSEVLLEDEKGSRYFVAYSNADISLESKGIQPIQGDEIFDIKVSIITDNVGLNIQGKEHTFATYNILESITEDKEGNPIFVTLLDDKKNKVTYEAVDNDNLVNEIASAIAIIEESRVAALNKFRESEQHPVFYKFENKEYRVYYNGRNWLPVSLSSRVVMKDSPFKKRLLNNFFTDLNIIINDEITENIRQGSSKEINNSPDVTALFISEEDTIKKVESTTESRDKGSKSAKDVVDAKAESLTDALLEAEAMAEQRAFEASLEGYRDIEVTDEVPVITKDQTYVYEPENNLYGDFTQLVYLANKEKELNEYLSNPDNDLKNNYIEFEIDYDSDYAKEWWANKTELKTKVQKGNKFVLEIEDINNYNSFIDEVPVIGKLYDSKGNQIEGHLYLRRSSNTDVLSPEKYQGDIRDKTREVRSKVLNSILEGNKVRIKRLSKDRGYPNVVAENILVKDALRIDTSKAELGVSTKDGSIRGLNNEIFEGISSSTGGNVFIRTNLTSNKEYRALNLNPSKLSNEHAGVVFDVFSNLLSRPGTRPSVKRQIKVANVEGLATAEKILDLLVNYGPHTKQKKTVVNPNLIDKQLYYEGKVLHYGNKSFNFVGKNENQIAQERQKFIDWAVIYKNYGISFNHFGTTFENNFSIGSLKGKEGQTYESYVLDNGFVKTNARYNLKTNSAYHKPALFVHFDNINSTETITEKPTKEEEKPKGETLDDIRNEFWSINHFYKKEVDYQKIDLNKELKHVKRQIGKNVSIQVVNDLIRVSNEIGNETAFGLVKNAAIKISTEAKEGTGYHEAFHFVTLYYLTDKQRAELYDDARLSYNLGESSDKYVNEKLAEEYEIYILTNQKVKPLSEKIADFFAKLWNFIKSVFVDNTKISDLTVKKLFKSIEQNKFSRAKVKPENLEKFGSIDYLKKIAGFNNEQIRNITSGLIYQVLVLNGVSNINNIDNIKYQPVYDWVLNRKNRFKELAEKISKDKSRQEEYKETIRLQEVYQDILNNFPKFVEYMDDMLLGMNIHKRIENDEDDVAAYNDENEDYESNNFEKYQKASYEYSGRDNILSNIKMFIATIPVERKIDSYSAMPIFEDFNTSWSKLMFLLWNSSNIYEMIDTLKLKANNSTDDYYNTLLYGITNAKGDLIKPGLINGDEELRTQFQVSVMKHRHNFINFLYNKNTKGMLVVDANVRKLSSQYLFDWNNRLVEDDAFFEGSERKYNKQHLLKIISEYTSFSKIVREEFSRNGLTLPNIQQHTTKLLSLLNKLHINITEDTLVAFLTQKKGSYDKNFIDLLSGKNSLELVFGTKGTLWKLFSNQNVPKNATIDNVYSYESIIRDFANLQAELSPDALDDTILGPDNNIYYVYSQNTYLTDTLRDLVKDPDLITKRSKVVYNKNSRFYKELIEGTKPQVTTMSALRIPGISNTGYLELSRDMDYLVKLNAVLQGYLPLPTLADRRSFFFYKGFKTLKEEFSDIQLDEKGNIVIPKKVIDVFKGYAEDEYNRINQAKQQIEDAKKNGYKGLIENYHYEKFDSYGNPVEGNALKFVLFKEFNKTTYNLNKVEKIIKDRIRDSLNYAKELGVINIKLIGGKEIYTNNLLDKKVIKGYKDKYGLGESEAIYTIISEFTTSYMMSIIETQKLLSGDPAFYKHSKVNGDIVDDFIKRVSVLAAPGDNYRTDYKEGEFAGKTKYNVVTLATQKYNSEEIYNKLKPKFIKLLKKIDPNISDQAALLLAEDKLKAYKNVDVTDAQVYITPEFYRELSIRIGEWSKGKQDAFDLLMSDKELTPEEELKASGVIMQPLKPVYFGIEQTNNLNIPVYDKMSMAVLLPRYIDKKSKIRPLIDKMREEGIDVVKFDSAVKVGNRDSIKYFKSDGSVNTTALKDIKKVVHKQSFRNLRRQQITDVHEASKRLIGTQLRKMVYANLHLEKEVYKFRGRDITGKELANIISKTFNALSNKGKAEFKEKLGIDENDKVDEVKLRRMLRSDAVKGNMPYNVIEALEEGIQLDTLPDRKWVESRLIALNTKHTIHLKSKGDAYIQVSNFGLHTVESDRLNLIDSSGKMEVMMSVQMFKDVIPNYNKKTFEQKKKWLEKNLEGIGYRIPTQGPNSVVVFSVKDFLPENTGNTIILPSEFTALTGSDFDIDKIFIARYNYNRKGNKVEFIEGDEGDLVTEASTWERIYQQLYQDKIFLREELQEVKEKVASKILLNKEKYGILFAEELTNENYKSMVNTLMSLRQEVLDDWNIKNITPEQVDSLLEDLNKIPDFDEWVNKNKKTSVYDLNSKEAVENRLLDTMFTVFTNEEHLMDTKTPLDRFTSDLKEIASELKKLEGKTKSLQSLEGIAPTYQIEAKVNYTEGKGGIGPFALNNVHHALAQISDLKIKFREYFKDGSFREFLIGNNDGKWVNVGGIIGKDGINILDWFSALISAHVDVAKDPYIFDINVVPTTYNVVSLLLRSGIGKNTFWFINQPLIKDNKYDLEDKNKLYNIAEKNKLKAVYLAKKEGMSKEDVEKIFNYNALPKNALGYSENTYKNFIKGDKDWKWYATQGGLLKAYARMLEPANLLSKIVLSTRTDTRGIGKNLAAVKRYNVNLEELMLRDDVLNLDKFMNESFLQTFHDNSAAYISTVYSGLMISSTKQFNTLVDRIISDTNVNSRNPRIMKVIEDELFTSIVSEYFTSLDGFGLSKEDILNLFEGKNSLPKRLYDLKESNLEFYNKNPFLKTLIPIFNTKTNIGYISTRTGDRGDKWVRDTITESWAELMEHEDDNIRTIARELVYYSFYMSGFNRSSFSFYHNIPIEFFIEVPSYFVNKEHSISYNDFIKNKREELQNEEIDEEYVERLTRDVYLNNSSLFVPLVQNISYKEVKEGDKVIPLLQVDKSKDLYRGLSDKGDPIYSRFIRFEVYSKEKNDSVDYVAEYIATEDDRNVLLYRPVDKKGFYEKGHVFKEYGLGDRSLVKDNNVKMFPEKVIQKVLEFENVNYVSKDDRSDIEYRKQEGVVETEVPVEEKEISKVKYKIPMKFKDGDGGREMRSEFKGKSTMDLILSGDRIATTRNTSKPYNQFNLQYGDVIQFYDDKGRVANVEVTSPFKPIDEVLSNIINEDIYDKLFSNKEKDLIEGLNTSEKDLVPLRAKWWSKLEGWSEKEYYRLLKEGTYEQFTFKLIKEVISEATQTEFLFETEVIPEEIPVVREYTPENITSLKSNEVFVFGSNTEGRHGKGAALIAKQRFGAKYGQAEGLQGQSYAIITKDLKKGEKSIPLNKIGKGIQDMLLFAKDNPNKKFYVAKLGSSLAGYSTDEIKGLFEQLKNFIPNNVVLPREYEVRETIETKDITEESPFYSDEQIELIQLIPTGFLSDVEYNKLQNAVANNMPVDEFKKLVESIKNCG